MMSSYFSYLLEANMILLILYGFYLLVLRLKASPHFNRFYLLGSLLLSLGIPLISIPFTYSFSMGNEAAFLPITEYWNFLPELVITGTKEEAPEANGALLLNWLAVTGYFYLTGLLACLALTAWKIGKLWKLIHQFPFQEKEGGLYKIAHTNGAFPTFSFLHFIFLDNTVPLNQSEKQQILHHEIAHVRQKHSLDLLLLECVRAPLWFNPLLWLFRKSLMQVHEHLADCYAVARSEKSSYLQLMVKQTLRQANIPLASLFFQHNTLNRIHMLQNKPTRTFLRATLSIGVIGIIFFVGACQDENLAESDLTSSPSAAEEYSMQIEKLQTNKPPLQGIKATIRENVIVIEAGIEAYFISNFKNEETFERTKEYARSLDGEMLDGTTVVERLKEIGNGKILLIAEDEANSLPTNLLTPSDNNSNKDAIFEVVEEQPVPEGGMEAFYKMVGENLKYPEEAYSNGIEGRVYVQFVVNTDGTVSEVKTVKGVGYGLDKAAEEVIKKSRWKPGQQNEETVAVRMVMPIAFRL